MDSGNSGSLQSSSGGAGGADEDYDPRTESMSSIFNHFNPNPIFKPPLSSPSSHHLQTLDATFFDPSYSNPNMIYDSVWSRNVRPDLGFLGGAQNDDVFVNHQSPAVSLDVNSGQVPATKNPKKRTRASRRAPTTVLTTDTTNFRQMVQEFTGIPTAPFAAASSPFSRRTDLFPSVFPVRPSPQKIQPDASANTNANANANTYQLPPSSMQSFQNRPQSLLNSQQNPLFSIQSLLQTKLPQHVNAPVLGSTNSGDQPSDGFASSSTSWRDQNENLVSFDGVNVTTPKVDGYKWSSSDFHDQTEKGSENVVSSRNGGDEA